MNVAILCETSGKVREAFRKRGHHAISIDILPSDDNSIDHLIGDIKDYEGFIEGWADLVIAHPPCTYLTNAGSRWLYQDRAGEAVADRWKGLIDGALLFRWCMELDVPKIAVENPIMHGHAVKIVGRKPDQYVQPWQHGHGETKATGLWLKGLPKLEPTNIVEGRVQRIFNLPPSEDRWKIRSETYQGIADAMASQWG